MEIQITGRNLEITPSIRDHIHKKFGKLTSHFQNITNIHVTLHVAQKFQHEAEALVDLSHVNIFANTSSEDMYASIDTLIDKIDRQVVEHKEKLKNHKNSPGNIPMDSHEDNA